MRIVRESETAGLPGLRRLSVIPCVSHPVPGASTQVEYLRKRVYIHTRIRYKKKHTVFPTRRHSRQGKEKKKILIHPLSHFHEIS